MGVTGSGKTTIGKLLSEKLGFAFYDADNFHPKENIEKMSAGIALNDHDRIPWLNNLQILITENINNNKNCVLACSALKETYREILLCSHDKVKLVFLKGKEKIISERLSSRKNHFMNPNLLKSQFNTLQEPTNSITVDVENSPEEIAEYLAKVVLL